MEGIGGYHPDTGGTGARPPFAVASASWTQREKSGTGRSLRRTRRDGPPTIPVGFRLLTLSRSIRRKGGICAGKVSAQGGVYLGGVSQGGLSRGRMPRRVCIPACNGADSPTPVNRITDRCKNINLPQTSFAGGKNPKKQRLKTDLLDNKLAQ